MKNIFRILVKFFRGGCGGIVVHLFSMVSFFASTRPIRLGVGAIDNPDQSGRVFQQHDISEVPEKNFSDDFSMACRQKN